MTPEETFSQLLGLGKSWRVVRTEYEVKESTFVICVEETPELWVEESSNAGTSVACYDHVEPMQWRHLNVFSKECVIICALPRGRRGDDGKVYRVTPPWEGRSKHFTREFEAFALTLIREMPVKRAGEILGETDHRMWRMLFAHVEALSLTEMDPGLLTETEPAGGAMMGVRCRTGRADGVGVPIPGRIAPNKIPLAPPRRRSAVPIAQGVLQ